MAIVTDDLSRCPATVNGKPCNAPYGRFTLGLDRDPTEPSATSTEAEREAAFQQSQKNWLKQQQARQQEDPEP